MVIAMWYCGLIIQILWQILTRQDTTTYPFTSTCSSSLHLVFRFTEVARCAQTQWNCVAYMTHSNHCVVIRWEISLSPLRSHIIPYIVVASRLENSVCLKELCNPPDMSTTTRIHTRHNQWIYRLAFFLLFRLLPLMFDAFVGSATAVATEAAALFYELIFSCVSRLNLRQKLIHRISRTRFGFDSTEQTEVSAGIELATALPFSCIIFVGHLLHIKLCARFTPDLDWSDYI